MICRWAVLMPGLVPGFAQDRPLPLACTSSCNLLHVQWVTPKQSAGRIMFPQGRTPGIPPTPTPPLPALGLKVGVGGQGRGGRPTTPICKHSACMTPSERIRLFFCASSLLRKFSSWHLHELNRKSRGCLGGGGGGVLQFFSRVFSLLFFLHPSFLLSFFLFLSSFPSVFPSFFLSSFLSLFLSIFLFCFFLPSFFLCFFPFLPSVCLYMFKWRN